jgi:LEA14-like dessication related protein
MNYLRLLLISAITNFLITGCAMVEDLIKSPGVEVKQIKSIWLTPEQWNLTLSVKLTNPNPVSLSCQHVIYNTEINGKKIQTKTLSDLPALSSFETRIFEIPLVLPLPVVLNSAPPKKHLLNLSISGLFTCLSQEQQSTLPFDSQATFPVPVMPILVFRQIQATGKSQGITCVWEIKNENTFPLQLVRTDGYLRIDSQKYNFISGQLPINIKSGEDIRVSFLAENTPPLLLAQKNIFSSSLEITAESDLGKIIVAGLQEIQE